MLAKKAKGLKVADEKLAYSASEAAETLGVSERHVRDMVSEGQIRVVRLGRRLLIPADALRELLATPTK